MRPAPAAAEGRRQARGATAAGGAPPRRVAATGRPRPPTKSDRPASTSREPVITRRRSTVTSVVSSLREAAEVLESMAIGAVNLASERSTESPYAGNTPEQQQLLVQQMQERKSYIYDAGQSVQIAEVFHRLADRAEPTVPVEIDRGDFISDQAAEYTERLERIETFVLGFRHVPGAASWFDNVGIPILDMAKGKKS